MAILDAIFNFSKRSMMPEWHQLDSSSTRSEQQESVKKETLKSSSRSFLFSTGLVQVNVLLNNCKQKIMSLSLLVGRTVYGLYLLVIQKLWLL